MARRAPEVFALTEFQRDALDRARAILDRRQGVVIADSVGLGKTYVGLALVEDCLRAGGHAVVAVPAALRRVWRAPLRRLHREAGGGGPRPTLLSHTALARGVEVEPPPSLVVVDEAHALRSPNTKRYRALAVLCVGARVVLITATPINNSAWDLYHLIRLFAADDAFADLGIPRLETVFRAAADEDDVERLHPLVRAVVVRRTRKELARRYGDAAIAGRFPRRAPPHPVRYSLEDAVPGLFEALESRLPALRFVPYREAGGPGSMPAGLLRLHLVKRLESSAAAFVASLRRQRAYTVSFRSALEEGRTLSPRQHAADRSPDGDLVQLVLSMALDPLPAGADTHALLQAVDEDLDVLDHLLDLARPLVSRDPKRDALGRLLHGRISGDKVVIFTEFRDTARDLWHALHPSLAVGRVDGSGAFLGARRAGRRAVIDRFAPRANGAPAPPPREAVSVLIATDVLAEGLNLQDSCHVVCYDLPWNPVRLIQRVGRIDRLGSPHEVVHAHFFLPGRRLDRPLGLLTRLEGKLRTIEGTVGVDSALPAGLSGYAEFASRLARGDEGVLRAIEDAGSAAHEPEERLRGLIALLPAAGGGALGDSSADSGSGAIPWGHVSGADIDGVLIGLRVERSARWILTTPGGRAPRDAGWDPDVVRTLEGVVTGTRTDAERRPGDGRPAGPGASSGRPGAGAHRAIRAAVDLVKEEFARRPGRPARAAGRLGRTIMELFGAGVWDPSIARRADAALAWLGAGHAAGVETALERLARSPAASRLPELLDALESLADRADVAREADGATREPEVVAVLELSRAETGSSAANPGAAAG